MFENVFLLGDSVKIKDNTLCPDYKELNIGGWTGKIIRICKDILFIQWDKDTLKNIPHDFIQDSELKDLDYNFIWLNKDKVISLRWKV